MRWLFAALVALLVCAPCFAQGPTRYMDYSIYVDILDDKYINETITLKFPGTVDSFNYYFLHTPDNLSIFGGDGRGLKCDLKTEASTLGTSLSCENISTSSVTINFQYHDQIIKKDGQFFYSDRYIFSTPTDRFNLKVILPKGYTLSENNTFGNDPRSFYPENAVQETDGKRISVGWTKQPDRGEVFSYYVSYEEGLSPGLPDDNMIWVYAIIALAALIMIALVYLKKKPTLKEYGLNNDERKILDALLKENKITQKKIVRETGFSKAHVSRLAKKLEERGIIERNKKGRSYEVILKK